VELLVSSPIFVDEGVVEFIDDVVLLRELLSCSKTSNTVVSILGQYLCIFCYISLAFVALDLVGGV
jgi:hypothetical protein